jgi:hypothetical protein
MSRTTLCVLTAGALAAFSVGLMYARHKVLGQEVKLPSGPGTWKVTMLVHGRSTGDARLMTATPLDFGHQHILREVFRSDELLDKPIDAKHPERRQVIWTQRAGIPDGPFRARCELYCSVNVAHPTAPMTELTRSLYAAPRPGEELQTEPGVESDHVAIAALARRLTVGIDRPIDQAEALFRHVDQEVGNEPTIAGPPVGALECLKNESGDAGAKSRLLVALCRNRGIPARLVTGLALTRGQDQTAHFWVEAWLRDQWLPMCPFYHYFGRVPRTYLVFGFGDQPMARGRNVRSLGSAFLIDRLAPDGTEAAAPVSWPYRLLSLLSLNALPPPEQRLVEFLLLLPIAALIVCIFRNIIGITSFGTFAPALLGLAFRNLTSMPGILVFVSIILIGWGMRRVLDRYHLLQVPRSAFLLSLVVLILITAIVTANYQNLPATKYISLFPMVILTGMIERFWTLEVEDSTTSSFRTLIATVFISCTISLVLGFPAVVQHMFRYPETLGLIMAVELLIGRYTGFRLTELYRFRDFTQHTDDGTPQTPLAA